MKKIFFFFFIIVLSNITFSQKPENYSGKPYVDAIYNLGAQIIPGSVKLAYYDIGGEGIAYHDISAENEGSKLNHENQDYGSHWRPGVEGYTVFFRENEGGDISYTNYWADFNHPNKVDPIVNQLYIGLQDDGEWTNLYCKSNKTWEI